jgi:hypothetical protein
MKRIDSTAMIRPTPEANGYLTSMSIYFPFRLRVAKI